MSNKELFCPNDGDWVVWFDGIEYKAQEYPLYLLSPPWYETRQQAIEVGKQKLPKQIWQRMCDASFIKIENISDEMIQEDEQSWKEFIEIEKTIRIPDLFYYSDNGD
jgi:hypothetical protein